LIARGTVFFLIHDFSFFLLHTNNHRIVALERYDKTSPTLTQSISWA
jgi:hypothetical protein